jgi:predicted HicB family RNase H-like nuclease
MGDRTERNRRTAPARNLYNAKTYDNITFRVRLDGSDGISRDQIKARAAAAGISVNQWIIEAIKDKI